MVERFRKKPIEGSDGVNANTSRGSFDFFKNMCKSQERDRQYKANMLELDNRLGRVTRGLEALTNDARSDGFWRRSSKQIKDEHKKLAESANAHRNVADSTSDKAAKDKLVSIYEDAIKRLEQLRDQLSDHIYNIKQLDKRMVAVGKRIGELIRDPRSSDFAEISQLQEARRDVVKYDASYKRSHDDISAHGYEDAIKRLEQLHDQLGDHIYRDKFVVNKSIITIYRTNREGELEMQSQARMNTTMERVEDKRVDGREVMFVKLDTGFQGLVDKNDVAKPVMKRYDGKDIGDISLHEVAVVTTPELETPLYRDATGDAVLDELHLGDRLSLIKGDLVEGRIPVVFPGNEKGWVKREDVEIRSKNDPFPRKTMEVAVEYAQAFLDKKVGFEYGGVSSKGIDLSGFIQNVCHMAGLRDMPRNSAKQYEYCQDHSELFRVLSEREETRAGDLIFRVKRNGGYHNAIAIDKHRYIHAVGVPESLPRKGVIVNCLPDCKEAEHEGHDPYEAEGTRGVVRMRLLPQEREHND